MIALIDKKTKEVIEIHDYTMDEFIKQKYSRFYPNSHSINIKL